jgi:hypothetical protein
MTETSPAGFQPDMPSFQTWMIEPALAAAIRLAASVRENGPL